MQQLKALQSPEAFVRTSKEVVAQQVTDTVEADEEAQEYQDNAEQEVEDSQMSSTRTDAQGNALNADGSLKLEEVSSVAELTDADFTTPTRSVMLPKLPDNVDNALGTDEHEAKRTIKSEEKSNAPLTKERAEAVIVSMEDNAVEDPRTELTPKIWLKTFGINNSIETPVGNVKMGENQYVKLQDKKRTSEFGMISLTLSNSDVIFIEPSKAKDEETTERIFSYVFAKTFKRNGEKIKYYASVTVSIDGLEISVSSHFVNPNKMLTSWFLLSVHIQKKHCSPTALNGA